MGVSLLASIAAFTLTPTAPGFPFGPESAEASVYRVGSLPSPRSRTSAVWANGSAYIFGGRVAAADGGLRRTGYEGSRDIVKYTPGGDGRVVAQLPPAPGFAGTGDNDGRRDTSAIWDGRYAYVFGGFDDCGVPIDQIIRFDPATEEVRILDQRLPLPTGGASAAWDGQSAYIFGGYVQQGRLGCQGDRPVLSDQIVRFTPGAGASTLRQRLPSPRNHAPAVFADPAIYIFGGHDGREALDEIVTFVPRFVEQVPDAPLTVDSRLPSPRHDASALWLPGNPYQTGSTYVFGGAGSNQDENAIGEVVEHRPTEAFFGDPIEVVDRLDFGSSGGYAAAHTSAVAADAVGGYVFGGELGPATADGARDLTDQVLRFTRPIRYAALGDSYSSGEGLGEEKENGPYLQGGAPACHRHPLAYPSIFATRKGSVDFDFLACSGSRTEHIYDGLTAPRPGERIQADGVNERTDLVTLTIGGNDVGKPDDEGYGGLQEPLKFCLLHKDCHRNGKFVAKLRSKIAQVAEGQRRAITALKQSTGPDTSIYLLGYPRVFPTDPNPRQRRREQDCKSLNRRVQVRSPLGILHFVRVGWTAGEQTFLNGALDRLNDQSRRLAQSVGIHFVDVTERFTGHAICDTGDGGNWISPLGISLKPPRLKTSSFHPNLEGQLAYADALQDSIALTTDLIRKGIVLGRLTPIGLPANPDPLNCPLVVLRRVKAVRRGKRSSFSGTIRDDFGVAAARLSFGDGSSRQVPIGPGGAFKLTHRYRKARTYKAALTVVGEEGARTKVVRKVRVKPASKRRGGRRR